MTAGGHFPLRQGNRFALLVDAEEFYPAMLNAIACARHYVLFEQYIMASGRIADRFIDALIAASGRGVLVFVQLDHFGVRQFAQSDRERLRRSGVNLIFYNPAYFPHIRRGLPRNHRKILIVDGRTAFTGGACISDDYDPAAESGQRPWHDTMVRIEGPVVADWQTLFVDNWRDVTGDLPNLPDAGSPQPVGGQIGRLATSRPGRPKQLKRSFRRQVIASGERVWIATAYFLPSRDLLRALRRAAARGADVRLMAPGPISDHPAVRYSSHRYYRYLLRNGIRIFEYQPRFLHAKVYLCDNWVSIGSCNMDRWNLHWNIEANQEIIDDGFASTVAAFFETDFSDCHEIRLSDWMARPWHERQLEWLWGYVDRLLERIRHKRDRPRRPGQKG